MKRREFITKAGLGTAGGLAVASGIGFPSIVKGAQEWRIHSTWPRNSPILSNGPKIVADYINKASNGRLTVRVAAAGDLVGPMEVFDAVADGMIQMGHGYPAFWSGKHPGFQFLAPQPFGMTSQEQNAWFSWGGGQELIDELYGEFGLKVFPSGNTSVQGIWFNAEINSVEDLRGLRVRLGGLAGSVLREAGATPVQLPLGEVTQALQAGTIDGADYVGPFNDMAFGLHRVARNYYWPGWLEPNGMLDCFVNQQAWESLDEDLQEIVRGANHYANSVVLSEFVAKNAQAMQELRNTADVNIRSFNAETLSELRDISMDIVSGAVQGNALAGRMYESISEFTSVVRPYSELTERDFMIARGA